MSKVFNKAKELALHIKRRGSVVLQGQWCFKDKG